MKPTKSRNHQTYRAMNQVVNKQICAPISKELRKKYSRRSIRIMPDDIVKVVRGEYKGLTGKVTKISMQSSGVAIEGNKKEKLKGEKIDVYIHSTNMIITSLNTDDKWRLKILEKKPKSKIKSMKEEAKKKSEVKSTAKKSTEKVKLNQQLKRKVKLNQQLKRKMTTKRVRKNNGFNSR